MTKNSHKNSHYEGSCFSRAEDMLARLPERDFEAVRKAQEHDRHLVKPAGSLGRLEEITLWMSGWQARHPPLCRRARIAIFAGTHGVAAQGVSAWPSAVTSHMVEVFKKKGAAINQLAACFDAELRVFPLELETPTADFTKAPAMSEEECARALESGMQAAEPGIDILCLGEMGIGNTSIASALCLSMFGGAAEEWTGHGAGLAEKDWPHKCAIVALAAEKHKPHRGFELLRRLGGREVAAIAGAILAARHRRIPVLLDGFICCAAAAVLASLRPDALNHCLAAHVSAEPGHARLLQKLDKTPLLNLGMRLGEASGAALALALIRAALAAHNGMVRLDQTGITPSPPACS